MTIEEKEFNEFFDIDVWEVTFNRDCGFAYANVGIGMGAFVLLNINEFPINIDSGVIGVTWPTYWCGQHQENRGAISFPSTAVRIFLERKILCDIERQWGDLIRAFFDTLQIDSNT